MQLLRLNAPVVAALKARLEADLSAAIDLVNADTDAGISAPPAIYDFVPPVAIITDFPTVGIGDGPTRLEDDTGFSATGRHDLLVIAYLQNADQAALATQLRAYASAIATCALDGRNLDAGAWGTGLIEIVPGPTLVDDPEKPQEFTSWVAVRIWAKSEEE